MLDADMSEGVIEEIKNGRDPGEDDPQERSDKGRRRSVGFVGFR